VFSVDGMVIGLIGAGIVLLGVFCTGFIAGAVIRDALTDRRSRRSVPRTPWQGWKSEQAAQAEVTITASPPARCAPGAAGTGPAPITARVSAQPRCA
jgi:hypothetical protein